MAPINVVAEFQTQVKMLTMEGPVIGARVFCQYRHTKIGNVVNAMTSMTRSRQDLLYVGEYMAVLRRGKVFYKCPPELVHQEALTYHGLHRDFYTQKYYGDIKLAQGYTGKWEPFVEFLMQHSPYGALQFQTRNFSGCLRSNKNEILGV